MFVSNLLLLDNFLKISQRVKNHKNEVKFLTA